MLQFDQIAHYWDPIYYIYTGIFKTNQKSFLEKIKCTSLKSLNINLNEGSVRLKIKDIYRYYFFIQFIVDSAAEITTKRLITFIIYKTIFIELLPAIIKDYELKCSNGETTLLRHERSRYGFYKKNVQLLREKKCLGCYYNKNYF